MWYGVHHEARKMCDTLFTHLVHLTSSHIIVVRRLIILCVGINSESSFEAALLERVPGCEVWGYDFTVNSVHPLWTSTNIMS
jgi:hypothetical protein